jgi:hypothetical protein
MKTIKFLLSISIVATLLNSCTAEVLVDDVETVQVVEVVEVVEVEPVRLDAILNAYDLWYVDINQTLGFGELPFLQKAFTVSFIDGVLYANTNLVGLGSIGDGFGIDVGHYDTFGMALDVRHDIDGLVQLEVFSIDANTLELYHRPTDTSYFLEGYQRRNFDYDFVFYDNIHYFLQEYDAWEKTFTSEIGVLNAFDNENYLQFLAGGDDATFRSSQDVNVTVVTWDYTGLYAVGNVAGTDRLKTLTLDYDFFSNEFFELSVVNDNTIELFHAASETLYRFEGRGNIQFLKSKPVKSGVKGDKTRKFRKERQDNPRA